ncbi:MAG: CocE/NonD family hydrolase [Ruminococcaceae bacterium]|nr:CocE/NonD family hydrolase [Oscillospiraceae bacterium]
MTPFTMRDIINRTQQLLRKARENMRYFSYYEYIPFDGESFFTVIFLPEKDGKFPTVIYRSPYVKHMVDMAEDDILKEYYKGAKEWLERGYAILYQHCRGQGKSSGAFVPYIHEREDGLALREWIREQPFYNGELFLLGGSYTASLHYATAPFEADIKGAVFEVQDSERYRLWYRNGQMRKGHANWHFGLYKDKCGLRKNFSMSSFSSLPLKGLSERVLDDCAEDFEQMLEADSPTSDFWNTRFGGSDTKDAVSDTDVPILLATGYNDFYVGGVFRMWECMSEKTRRNCALLVSPYDHGDGYHSDCGVFFPKGQRKQAFGGDYQIAWFDHIRKGTSLPFEKGIVTYYRAFENKWQSDFFKATNSLTIPLGTGASSFEYDPLSPPAFRQEGLLAEDLTGRSDVLCVCTPAFDEDTFVKGQMKVILAFESNVPDTSVYVRVSIKKSEYTYVLRHDITSLCYQLGTYKENSVAVLNFSFDEYAFLIKKGECLQIDISSTDNNAYVCHTNKKGAYYLQNETNRAENTVHLDKSYLVLPVE